MTRPNFFIVGAPKSGTTALSEYLRSHPQIFVSRPKEPFFFCDDFRGLPGPRRAEDYLRLFRSAPAEAQAVGEASAMYLYSRVALSRIREFAPSARIIAMLRNPVQLAPSFHSQQLYGVSEDEPDFGRAWALQDLRLAGKHLPRRVREPAFLQYRCVARLGEQVQRLLEIFPRDQILLILFDDFLADPKDVYETVLSFLTLESDGRTEFGRVNPNKRYRSARLARLLQRPPSWMSGAATRFKRTLGLESFAFLDLARRANAEVSPRTPLSPELRSQLLEEFRPDVAVLARLLERDLTHWLTPP